MVIFRRRKKKPRKIIATRKFACRTFFMVATRSSFAVAGLRVAVRLLDRNLSLPAFSSIFSRNFVCIRRVTPFRSAGASVSRESAHRLSDEFPGWAVECIYIYVFVQAFCRRQLRSTHRPATRQLLASSARIAVSKPVDKPRLHSVNKLACRLIGSRFDVAVARPNDTRCIAQLITVERLSAHSRTHVCRIMFVFFFFFFFSFFFCEKALHKARARPSTGFIRLRRQTKINRISDDACLFFFFFAVWPRPSETEGARPGHWENRVGHRSIK